MNRTGRSQDWTRNDPISNDLLGLAAGRGLPTNRTVTSELVDLAQHHGLIGILSMASDSTVVTAIQARNEARQAIMRRRLQGTLEALESAGIRAAVIKGPAIAEAYRVTSHRGYSDLDLLVEESSLDAALATLQRDKSITIPEKRPKADKRDITIHDESGVRFNLDLHWDLYDYTQLRGMAEGAVKRLWDSASHRPDSSLGPLWELPEWGRWSFLAAHSVLDHRFRLILFRDFVELARHPVDWEALIENAESWGLRSVLYIALWIGAEAVGADIPEDVLTRLRPPSEIVTFLERQLPKVDIARFDGRTVHPVNLASVLLNDSLRSRIGLAVRAPMAFPGWRKRSAEAPERTSSERILLVVASDARRGAEVFAERLQSGFRARGLDPKAVSLTHAIGPARANVEAITDVPPSDAGRLHPRIAWALRRVVSEFEPDAVVAVGPTLRYAVLATLSRRSRLVYVAIGEPRYWLRRRFSRPIQRTLLRQADLVIAVSSMTKTQLLQVEPSLGGRVEVAHTGVPSNLFHVERSPREESLRVVVIGALSAEKDPVVAVEAVAGLVDAKLRIVGSGPLEQDVLAAAADLAAVGRFELMGAVDDVSPHLAWADVLLLTSRTEGLPGAVLEAGSVGVVTVAYDVGGVREAVVEGVTGIIVPWGDLAALRRALESLSADRDLLSRMSRAARIHVEDSFGLEKVTDDYARLVTAKVTHLRGRR